VLSISFPKRGQTMLFRIMANGSSFTLEPQRECRLIEDRAGGLAVAVSSHGLQDIVAVLTEDGKVERYLN